MSSVKAISLGILVTLIIILVVYIILMFEWYKNQTVVFSPYTPGAPPADQDPYYPISNIQPMSQEQICTRNINIYCSNYLTYGSAAEPSQYGPNVPTLNQCAAILYTTPPASINDICNGTFVQPT